MTSPRRAFYGVMIARAYSMGWSRIFQRWPIMGRLVYWRERISVSDGALLYAAGIGWLWILILVGLLTEYR